jgi:chromosomal replication initiation ATPase DnaA
MVTDKIEPQNIKENCLIEDIEQCQNQESLLHLYNHCKDINVKLLLTSSCVPSALPFTLPDLTSRLRACQLVTINPPDDSLITNVMRKQFSDRQLMVDDEVIAYLAPRMERTLAGVKEMVERLDAAALAEQKNITIPFVKRIFGY